MTRLVGAFLEQATHCEHLGSRFMARLLRLLASNWPIDTALMQRLEAWQGDIGPNGAFLPLRLAAALHALVLTGQEAQLRTNYPPHQTSDNQLLKTVQTTMTHHHIFIDNWLSYPPQTNEVARSAELIPAAMWLQQHHQLPICLSELGASAGLDLGFDHFALTVSRHRFGPEQPVLHLTPDWHGPVPTEIWPTLHLIYYTIAWQYLPRLQQARGRALLAHAGAQATKHAPLAWLSIEADTTGQSRTAIRLRLWPANVTFSLGRADFHSRWIDWTPPI